jgi:SAM-dependent methyltransferase
VNATVAIEKQDPPVEDRVQTLVNRQFEFNPHCTVLEAGCGSRSHITLGPGAQITGIDISQAMLDKNPDLDVAIRADLQEYTGFRWFQFDIVFCWDVLEHLQHPERALDHLFSATKAGGLIVLGAPVVTSLKGMITKFTPHWFHVWAYRNIFGNQNAGKPGFGPFKTYLRSAMSPKALLKFAAENDLTIEHFDLYEAPGMKRLRERDRVVRWFYRIVGPAVKLFGIEPDNTDFTLVLRRR